MNKRYDDMTEQEQVEAIKHNNFSLLQVKPAGISQQPQSTVAGQNSHSIRFVLSPWERDQVDALVAANHPICLISNPSEMVQIATVKENPSLIRFIKRPFKSVYALALSLNPSIKNRGWFHHIGKEDLR